jgi:hypothetical protein
MRAIPKAPCGLEPTDGPSYRGWWRVHRCRDGLRFSGAVRDLGDITLRGGWGIVVSVE